VKTQTESSFSIACTKLKGLRIVSALAS
jgi:hypothetical protein